MPTRTPLRVALLAGALAAAAPVSAEAASVTPGAACYVMAGSQAQPITAAVSGLAAGQAVQLRVARKGVPGGTGTAAAADPVGNIGLSVDSWFVPLGSGPKKEVAGTLDVVDTATGAVVTSAGVSLANLDYSVTGSGRLRTWKIQGLGALAGNATYYAHYLNNGKYKGRQKIGTGKGACGYVSVKRPLTPFRKLGRYDVTIQASKKLDPNLPSFKGRVVVTKRYR